MVFDGIGKDPDISLFPSVGLRCTGETIRANFGSHPFRYAISDHVRSRRDVVWASVSNTPVDWVALDHGKLAVRSADDKDKEKDKDGASSLPVSSSASAAALASVAAEEQQGIQGPMKKLVLAYLAHHGYARTARAFQEQCAKEKRQMRIQAKGDPRGTYKMNTDAIGEAVTASSSRTRLDGMEDEDEDASMMETDYTRDLHTRIAITNALLRGDVDSALELTKAHHPVVLEREEGLVQFKMRCRKFVELVLEAGVAFHKVKELEMKKPDAAVAAGMQSAGRANGVNGANGTNGADVDVDVDVDLYVNNDDADADVDAEGVEADVDLDVDCEQDGEGEMDYGIEAMDELGAMDVDDPSPEARPVTSTLTTTSSSKTPSVPLFTTPSLINSAIMPIDYATQYATLSALAKSALHTALKYGQELETDYKSDMRPLVKVHLRKTFGIVAFHDPVAEGGEVAEMAGQAARVALASEVNQAILRKYSLSSYPVEMCCLTTPLEQNRKVIPRTPCSSPCSAKRVRAPPSSPSSASVPPPLQTCNASSSKDDRSQRYISPSSLLLVFSHESSSGDIL